MSNPKLSEITLRDEVAMRAAQAFLTSIQSRKSLKYLAEEEKKKTTEIVAILAFEVADAFLLERDKQTERNV